MSGRAVSRQELDDALAAGRVKIGRVNQRLVHCTVFPCRGRMPPFGLIMRNPGHAWRLFVDGHNRGFICEDCWPPGSLFPLPKGA